MDGIGKALVFMFVFCVIVGGVVTFGVTKFFSEDDIRVKEPLVPEIELVVEDNVVDTVYVYKRP